MSCITSAYSGLAADARTVRWSGKEQNIYGHTVAKPASLAEPVAARVYVSTLCGRDVFRQFPEANT